MHVLKTCISGMLVKYTYTEVFSYRTEFVILQ